MYFEAAARDIRALPKLEGTVHVNMALIIKFMPNYFFNPADYPPLPRRDEPLNDDFLFHQGPAKGLPARPSALLSPALCCLDAIEGCNSSWDARCVVPG
jgi:hypothetical protein